LYLGPDEHIIPQDIEWIIQQGIKRSYSLPQALMSSKPKNGINHKEYGVTSLGVAENLEVALTHLGVHPSATGQPFTVKLTGGTDGDVGGNMLRQLSQRYGTDAKVVGLADGTACLEDPDGLDMGELIRMVDSSEPLSHFDASLLGPQGNLATTDTVEGTLLRDTMHNRVAADAFVPCGGRPGTINVRNYREYLSGPEGAPSSKVIVEGANLFITPEARQLLFDEGQVVVMKDSSANKCGVVTSSYEILASMLVTPEEFLSMKEDLVPDVLAQLQRLARVEAETLFSELAKDPRTALPKQSEHISSATTKVHDAVQATLKLRIAVDAQGKVEDWQQVLAGGGGGGNADAMTVGDLLETVATEHVPKALLQAVGTDALRALPWPYLRNLIACNLATKLVYAEGPGYVDAIGQSGAEHQDQTIADVAFRYVTYSTQLVGLIKQVQDSDIEGRERVAALLKGVVAQASMH